MFARSPRSSLRLRLRSTQYLSTSHPSRQDVRPTTAPKQTPNLKSIRLNPLPYSKNAVVRNYRQHEETPQTIADALERNSQIERALKEPRKTLKEQEKLLAKHHGTRDEGAASLALKTIKELKPQIELLEAEKEENANLATESALALPNFTSSHTPTNGEVRILGYLNYDPGHPPEYAPGTDHSTIGQKLGILDFTSASTTAGWGFYYLLNEAALLEQALVQYALSVARKHGWAVVTPPSLVYSHIANSCGFQPRDANDEQQIWQVAQSGRDAGKPRRSLAATAEIPLAALYANKDIPEQSLPIKLVGSSRCYRAEAGARGVDTKGLYRVHEFTKVEMFAWTSCPPARDGQLLEETDWTEKSTLVFDEMVDIQKEILTSLGLPCRVLEMPSNDMGASAYRKIDIEALFPSRMSRDEGWGELTSVSICTDYQSRRLNTRIKEPDGSKSKFAHTLNGTALAVPRVLACILENGWLQEEGCVIIPEVLRPFMGGIERVGPLA